MSQRVRDILKALARAGYAARGFVYVSIGLFALAAALELTPRVQGGEELLAALGEWPFGQLWLGSVGVGLLGFALWRGLQSVLDADRQGRKPKALASRLGQALSGVIYAALAWSVFGLLDIAGEFGASGGGGEASAEAAEVLGLPGGRWLLVAVAVFVAASGVGNVLKGLFSDFCRRLSCRDEARATAKWLGRSGYVGRGLAFLPLAFFLLEAGLDRNAAGARSLGDTLQALERQPFGSTMLSVLAVGLIAFGLFAFAEARWRRIDVPRS
jgi:hypothetical protein